MIDRLAVIAYEWRYPERPWLTGTAISILMSWLRQTDVVCEYGSGRSTLWFARRVSAVTSIEHDETWYHKVSRMAKETGVANLDYRLIPTREHDVVSADHPYPAVVNSFAEKSFDLVLVDGVHRDICANLTLPFIKPGGMLVLDNANWYLPGDSRSPNSRTYEEGPSTLLWREFLISVKDWRFIWTTNGVWDTALYIKPSKE